MSAIGIAGVERRADLRAVRYNNRSIAPLCVPAERMAGFYRAYQRLSQGAYADRDGLLSTLRLLERGRLEREGGGRP